MKLGFRNDVDQPKMVKTWLAAAMGALCIFGGAARVAAQDMSFDLEEAETTGEGQEGEAKPKEGEAKGEAGAEGEV